jgi:hypothetical protein
MCFYYLQHQHYYLEILDRVIRAFPSLQENYFNLATL